MTFSIALQRPKNPENVGAVLRLALCWEASSVRRCLNLAHAVGVTLYDRSTKIGGA